MRALMALTAIVLWPVSGSSQPAWESVQRLSPDRSLSVELRSGQILKGELESAGAHGLRLRTKGGRTVEASKESIARVVRKSRKSGALWGAMAGFGCAAPVGWYAGPYIADYGNPSIGVRSRHAAGWGLFFGGVGAGIGALAGAEKTVYRAPPVRPPAAAPGTVRGSN